MLGEDLLHELAAAGHADLLEDGLDVVAHGVGREVELRGDLRRCRRPRAIARVTSHLALGEPVGLDDQRRDVGRLGRLDDERQLVGPSESVAPCMSSQTPVRVRIRVRTAGSRSAVRGADRAAAKARAW